MAIEQLKVVPTAENYRLVRGLLHAQVSRGELELPVLPEVAARVVAVAASPEMDAPGLARIITGDPALAAHVMRVATSAAYQPRTPIESLPHAISWLGMAEVSDIAFTVAVQGKLMNVPGQKHRVQRMWTSAVATGLWSRAVGEASTRPGEASYLSGLLHEIGKPVCLQAAAEISRRSASPLVDAELDALIEEFHVEVGMQLAAAWKLPPGVAGVIRSWRDWECAPERRDDCAVVWLAHQFAVEMLEGNGSLAAEALAEDPVAEHLGLGLPEVLALYAQTDHVRALVDNY